MVININKNIIDTIINIFENEDNLILRSTNQIIPFEKINKDIYNIVYSIDGNEKNFSMFLIEVNIILNNCYEYVFKK